MPNKIQPNAIINDSIEKSKLAQSVKDSLNKADTALQPSALNPYRTSAQQDAIDNGKVNNDAPKDGNLYGRRYVNGSYIWVKLD